MKADHRVRSGARESRLTVCLKVSRYCPIFVQKRLFSGVIVRFPIASCTLPYAASGLLTASNSFKSSVKSNTIGIGLSDDLLSLKLSTSVFSW
jgi:hypothetical protein